MNMDDVEAVADAVRDAAREALRARGVTDVREKRQVMNLVAMIFYAATLDDALRSHERERHGSEG